MRKECGVRGEGDEREEGERREQIRRCGEVELDTVC